MTRPIILAAAALLIGAAAVSSAGQQARSGAKSATIARDTTPQGDPYVVRARPIRYSGSPGVKLVDEHPRGSNTYIVAGSRRALQRQVSAGVSKAGEGDVWLYGLVYGTLPRRARKAVVRLASGTKLRARSIRAPRPLRSLRVRFFVIELHDPEIDPTRVVALDKNGRPVARSPRL